MIRGLGNSLGSGAIFRIKPFLNLASVIILGTIFLAWDLSRAVYVLLSLGAIVYLIKSRPSLPRIHRFYTWPVLGFVGVAALSVAYHGWSDSDLNALTTRYFLLLLAVPLPALFYVSYDPERNPYSKFLIGSVVIGIIALFNVLVEHQPRAYGGGNAAGGGNAVVFGFIALVMIIPLIASYPYFRKARFGKLFFFCGILMGLCAMFLSGTRSSWIIAVLLIVVATFFYLDFYTLSKRILIALALIGCFVIAGLSIPSVQERTEQMVKIFTPYVKGDQQSEFTSLRYRVEAWKASWHIGMTEPVFGIGPGNSTYKKSIQAYVEENPHLVGLESVMHTHNQFLHSFALNGFAGLIAFVILLSCHFWLFASFLRKCYSTEVRSLALAGVMILIAYVLFSIPEVAFYGKTFLLMYAFTTASIWGSLLGALRASKQEGVSPAGNTGTVK